MRIIDAPREGWYPDPDGRQRLRWWDGLDWTDIKRAPPSTAELTAAEQLRQLHEPPDLVRSGQQLQQVSSGLGRQDVQDIIAEVRTVARSEIDRAANEFTNRANSAVRGITPLISEYTSSLLRWIRRAVIVAIVLLVAYFVFQVVVQASFFSWLGDRIDNWTSNDAAPTWRAASDLLRF